MLRRPAVKIAHHMQMTVYLISSKGCMDSRKIYVVPDCTKTCSRNSKIDEDLINNCKEDHAKLGNVW